MHGVPAAPRSGACGRYRRAARGGGPPRPRVGAVGGDPGGRAGRRPAALAAAAGYVRREFEALGYCVAAQTYRVSGIDCDNLEVVIPGAARPEEIILVGAHYDTVEGSPGADDNASGVAGGLDLARRRRGARLAATVKLVAFVNEEPPLFFWGEMGRKGYAEAARRG